jgi:protein NirF
MIGPQHRKVDDVEPGPLLDGPDRRNNRFTVESCNHKRQPVFAVARPDGRYVWVNFAHPLNDTIDIVDTESLKVIHRFAPGPAVLHMEFTPRGNEVWVSVRDADRVDVYDAATFARKAEIPAQKPSGIFFTARATRIGQ